MRSEIVILSQMLFLKTLRVGGIHIRHLQQVVQAFLRPIFQIPLRRLIIYLINIRLFIGNALKGGEVGVYNLIGLRQNVGVRFIFILTNLAPWRALVYAKHTPRCQKVFFYIFCNFVLLML